MWHVPVVTGVMPCRDVSDLIPCVHVYIMAITDLAITPQPVVQIQPFKMRWKALSELHSAMVVCQWCHVTLPPSSKTQSSRCGFELKAHTMQIDWCSHIFSTTKGQWQPPNATQVVPTASCIPHHKRLPVQRLTKPRHDGCSPSHTQLETNSARVPAIIVAHQLTCIAKELLPDPCILTMVIPLPMHKVIVSPVYFLAGEEHIDFPFRLSIN